MNRGTIFIVEDDEEFARILQIRLQTMGFHVLRTSSGGEAFGLIEAAQPDAVLLDVFLPDMDGLTILKRLKSPVDIETGKPSTTKRIPVVVLTGKAPMVENMVRMEGACDFFLKPVDISKLEHRLGELMETKHNGND